MKSKVLVVPFSLSFLALAACGTSPSEAPQSAEVFQAAHRALPVRRNVTQSIPVGSVTRPGELEPQCKAAIRYIFAVVNEANQAVMEYCNRRGDGCVESTTSTRDPIKITLGLSSSLDRSGTASSTGDATSTIQGNVTITVGVDIPLGAQRITTVIPATATGEMQAFITQYFSMPDTFNGIFSSCKGLGSRVK